MSGGKKFTVVLFDNQSAEVVPSNWLIDEKTMKWPGTIAPSIYNKMVLDCMDYDSDWETVENITIKAASNKYSRAVEKLHSVLNYKTPDEDSEYISDTVRDRKKPKRLHSYTMESPSPQASKPRKMYNIPEPLYARATDPSGLAVSQTENYPAQGGLRPQGECLDTLALTQMEEIPLRRPMQRQMAGFSGSEMDATLTPQRRMGHSSGGSGVEQWSSGVEQRRVAPATEKRKVAPAKQRETCTSCQNQEALNQHLLAKFMRLSDEFQSLKGVVMGMNTKIDQLLDQRPSCNASVVDIPPDVDLPLASCNDLANFDLRLKTEKKLSAILVKYLYDAGYGKTPSAFIQSITKKVLSQELATQFSRCGRKGKKNFLVYHNTLNLILAAASMRFGEEKKHTLSEHFGRALANAPDWGGRKKDIQVSNEDQVSNEEDGQEDNPGM